MVTPHRASLTNCASLPGAGLCWAGGLVAIATLIMVLVGLPKPALAHEVHPSIADLTLSDGTARIVIDTRLEAVIAGVDLDGVDNTRSSPKAPDYDRLRLLPPEELEAAFRAHWPQMREQISVLSEDGGPSALRLDNVQIPPVGNKFFPRTSRITLEADVAGPVQFSWAKSYGDVLLRQRGLPDDKAYFGLLRSGEASPAISATGGVAQSAWETFARYIMVGFVHIIPMGLDHILFVLGLFFLTPKITTLVWQVSAFTLAHTVTLALGALGWLTVSPSIVEPLIAASIVYVAVENIFTDGLNPWRPVLIFAFGLLHGLGFASVLGDFGLPEGQFVPALVGFNIGVEVGHLAVLAIAFAFVGVWFRSMDWYRPAIAVPASCLIAGIGAFWVLERTGVIA